MKFQHQLTIPRWDRAQADPQSLIACIPGILEVLPEEGGSFAVKAVNGIGPVRLKLSGTAKVSHPDADSLLAEVTLHEPIAGTIYGTFHLHRMGELVELDADLTLGGRLGEFAQPLLRKKAQDTVKGFQKNLQTLV